MNKPLDRKTHSMYRVAFLAPMQEMELEIWRGMLRELNRDGRFLVARNALTENALDTIRAWKPHVAVAYISNDESVELARRLEIPIINLSGILAHPPFPTITVNNRLTGEICADHLLEKRYTNFAFIGDPAMAYAESRCQGFVTRIESAGYKVHRRHGRMSSLGMSDPNRHREHAENLSTWFRKLPRPVGLMVMDDNNAFGLVELLELAGVDVLSEAAVISAHHGPLPFSPSISGVQQREELWGVTVGRMAIRLALQDRKVPSLTEIDPAGIVEQESTAGVCTEDEEVMKASRFIRQSVQFGINVKDVVANGDRLGRRALERRFQNVMGHTILEEIQRARMDRARKLMRESDENLQDVALQAGFTDHKHLQRVFTEREGMTPGSFRKQKKAV